LRRRTTWLPLPEPFHFGGLELAPRAGLEPFERQARVTAAVEADHRVADGFEHPLDLVLAALVNRELELGRCEAPDAGGRGAAVVELDA
jgi:hypothetical protein